MFQKFHLVEQVFETFSLPKSHLVTLSTVTFEDQYHLFPILH